MSALPHGLASPNFRGSTRERLFLKDMEREDPSTISVKPFNSLKISIYSETVGLLGFKIKPTFFSKMMTAPKSTENFWNLSA